MRGGLFLGIFCAVALHVAVILFGGLVFNVHEKKNAKIQQVELLSEADTEPEKKKPEEPEPEPEEMETETEAPPDASEIIRNIELSAAESAPELEAVSLSAIEAALSGQGSGGGDFAEGLSFASGGRIGGKGKGGSNKELDEAFSMSEIDQKPRAISQADPIYPAGMRSVEGMVTAIFVVDQSGKVINPRVEKSTHPEFEKPAIDAVKQWKFEPAMKGGQKVSSKMRVPIRFQPRS